MANLVPEGRWSHAHERCVSCGTCERPHIGRGLCGGCYERSPERRTYHRERKRIAYRTTHELSICGPLFAREPVTVPVVKDGASTLREKRNAQARSRWAAKNDPPFPRLGAPCVIVLTGEIGRIVGYSQTYDEWLVRIPGQQDLHWEPCDLAPAPAELRRAA